MALDSQKKIVPQEIILNGDANDVFLKVVKENGAKVFEVFGDGKIAMTSNGSKVFEVFTDGKVSFFGKAGVAQAAAAAGTQVAEATWSADEVNMLNTAYNALKNLGIIA